MDVVKTRIIVQIRTRLTRAACILAAIACSSTATAAQIPAYSVTQIPSPAAGWGPFVAWSINNSGMIVGSATTPAEFAHAVLWNGVNTIDLGTLPGGSISEARSINNAGQIVGYSSTSVSSAHAVIWAGTAIQDLGNFGGRDAFLTSINSFGHATGVVDLLPPPGSSAAARAIFWDGTAAILLDSLGGNVDFGYAINDSDEIVGFSSYTGLLDDRHGVTWSGTAITSLPSSLAFSPLSINNSGNIAGAGLVPGAPGTFAALWNGTTLVNLGSPSGSASSYAAAINDAGAVVGSSTLMTYAGPVGQRATLWQGASIYDLNSLAEPALPPNYVLTSANLLNDNGWIVAIGSDGVVGDSKLAFVMVPLNVAVSTNTLTFGNQAIGSTSAAQTITVTNQGNAAFAVGALTTTGDFTQTNNCGTSLAPTASCSIQITFRPSTPGTIVSTVTLGSGQSTYAISLNGIGTFDVMLTASAAGTVGAPLVLSWSSTPGAVCTPSGGSPGDGWSGTLGASGTIPVTESSVGNYKYGLTCALDGVSNSSPQLIVLMTVPTVTLSAAPPNVTVGQAVSLTWNSTNAASCVASGGESGDGWAGSKPVSGTLSVTTPVAGTITYTIVCSNPPQSAQALAQVIATGSSSKSGGGSLGTFSVFALIVLCGGRLLRDYQRKNPGY